MSRPPRISIIMPTRNAADTLPAALNALLPGVEIGLIRDVVISDGGSDDETAKVADAAGAELITGPAGRGGQLARGAIAARGDWLLFLHADTYLSPDWPGAVAAHIQNSTDAAVFRLSFRAKGIAPLLVSGWANLRTRLFDLPYGDQGLLISRTLYDDIGGYPDQPLMEDVSIARALKGKITMLASVANTSADKYVEQGWVRRGARNLLTLARYFLGADPNDLVRSYQKS